MVVKGQTGMISAGNQMRQPVKGLLSKLVRNVPVFNSLEMALNGNLIFSLCCVPERSPAF